MVSPAVGRRCSSGSRRQSQTPDGRSARKISRRGEGSDPARPGERAPSSLPVDGVKFRQAASSFVKDRQGSSRISLTRPVVASQRLTSLRSLQNAPSAKPLRCRTAFPPARSLRRDRRKKKDNPDAASWQEIVGTRLGRSSSGGIGRSRSPRLVAATPGKSMSGSPACTASYQRGPAISEFGQDKLRECGAGTRVASTAGGAVR